MPSPARYRAVAAIAAAADRFPDLPPTEPDLEGLSPADARLATAIHRTTLQRWITLEHLLNRQLKQPMAKLDGVVRAVLLTASAQLIFLDRLPDYAVIDDAVALTKRLRQARAAGMVNAVLRKIAGLTGGPTDEPWHPSVDRLPMPGGGSMKLNKPCLPKPDNLLAHLTVATSHPMQLLQRWFKLFGKDEAARLALHSLENAPTFVVDGDASHLWEGTHDELVAMLAAEPSRRVQDPASVASVASTSALRPRQILDLCAGRGTKTRQLLRMHPQARVTAYDPDDGRRTDLQRVPGVTVADPQADERFDLILVDVPCSNTGVLARRPEARYRATASSLDGLVELQRSILDRAVSLLSPSGHLLYATCSIDPAENQEQVAWLLNQCPALTGVSQERTILPQGRASQYHDGSYHALVGPLAAG